MSLRKMRVHFGRNLFARPGKKNDPPHITDCTRSGTGWFFGGLAAFALLAVAAVNWLAPSATSPETSTATLATESTRIAERQVLGKSQKRKYWRRKYSRKNGYHRTGKSQPMHIRHSPFLPFGAIFSLGPPGKPQPIEEELPPLRPATYRTVCVRMCDGYFFPISAATRSNRFAADEAQCKSSCNAPAKLFVAPSGSGKIDALKDRRGNPYSDLENAYLYRTEYVEDCSCRPQPWSEEAKKLHAYYALKEKQDAGDKLAGAELEELLGSDPMLAADVKQIAKVNSTIARKLRAGGRKRLATHTLPSGDQKTGLMNMLGGPQPALINTKPAKAKKKKRRWKRVTTTQDVFRRNMSTPY